MLRVGLTGGIGAGKSAAATMFRSLGLPTLDLDLVSRQVTRPGQPAVDLIAQRFGADLISPDGALDRARLAEMIFPDPQARKQLEEILHPAILDASEEWVRAQGDRPDHPQVVMLEIPLLFEAGLQDTVDRIVLVVAPPAMRVQRLVVERSLSQDAALARIASQLTDDVKRERSHYVLDNSGSREELEAAVRGVSHELLEDARRALSPE